ncbi:hypothetical protein CH333_05770 [candidate division WOR-3 bacterium JGI_Cruoil_03_44_89]|uniref:Uncharacterized protein n=1 Tax=candidate division WOR-3 bacterium JGI_Cruoil_03_44_89 TaxID=1973748 RepID=A0A235BUI2_UNCW3|nr:MAG: hypothetical protein CH333_05770 [candidate division WOR-3 bacterium JGI_Cruoil_03_44_89]
MDRDLCEALKRLGCEFKKRYLIGSTVKNSKLKTQSYELPKSNRLSEECPMSRRDPTRYDPTRYSQYFFEKNQAHISDHPGEGDVSRVHQPKNTHCG